MEFWESNFKDKQEMWGLEPAKSAIIARDLLVAQHIGKVLIPGSGYGRNAQVFRDCGIQVTGIEISETAIAMARKHFGHEMTIHHGSVTDMPFDRESYDGIFCYALIHLLDDAARKKLIADCYSQLQPGGIMVFTVISKEASTYGTGKLLGKDRYELFGGVSMYFYDETSIRDEFGAWGLTEIKTVTENYPFFFISCRKEA